LKAEKPEFWPYLLLLIDVAIAFVIFEIAVVHAHG
jgi:hypothetical protein